MANLKIYLFDSPSKQLHDGSFPVTLKVTHQRKRKYFSLERRCLISEWDAGKDRFRRNYPNYKMENSVLDHIEHQAQKVIRDFEIEGTPFSFRKFEEVFLQKEEDHTLVSYFDQWIRIKEEEKKFASASQYLSARNAILEYWAKGTDLLFSDVDSKFLHGFERWLRSKRNCKDTSISVYMQAIRSLFNKAIKEDKIIKQELYPFYEYKISKLKKQTQKRAIPKEKVKEIENLVFEEGSALRLAQDIFLFIYYTRGINFVDIAHLTEENIANGRILYQRKKTKKIFNIGLHPKAEEILNYYRQNKKHAGPYIFPVFDELVHQTEKQRYHRRKTLLRKVNKSMTKIAQMVGIENLKVTTYVGRHTYATTLKNAGISIAVISEALGHESENVTQIYLKQFDHDELDQADLEAL